MWQYCRKCVRSDDQREERRRTKHGGAEVGTKCRVQQSDRPARGTKDTPKIGIFFRGEEGSSRHEDVTLEERVML